MSTARRFDRSLNVPNQGASLDLDKCEFGEKSIQPGSDRTTVRVGSPAYYKFHAWVEMNAKEMENKSSMLSTSGMAKAREGIISQWNLHQELRAKDILSDAQIQKWDKTGSKMKRLGASAQAEEKSSGTSAQAASKSKTCSSNAKYCADWAEPKGTRLMNVALERPGVSQSTTADIGRGNKGDAKKAVDGEANSSLFYQSCAFTGKQRNRQSWWRVDVGAKTKVHRVQVYISPGARFQVHVGDSENRAKNQRCGAQSTGKACGAKACQSANGNDALMVSTMVGCGGIKTGRYVHIVLATKHAQLKLCEVQVTVEVAGDVCENAPLKSDTSA